MSALYRPVGSVSGTMVRRSSDVAIRRCVVLTAALLLLTTAGGCGARSEREGPAVETCDGSATCGVSCDDPKNAGCPCDGPTLEACYDGPVETIGVGICRGGSRVCAGGIWSACE